MMRGFETTGRVVNALRAARAEAMRLDCGCVSPELLLLGILAEEQTTGARVLVSLGATREVVTHEVEKQIGRLPRYETTFGGMLPYTSAAKRALQGAMDAASDLGHPIVDTEHLLLGILRDDQSDTARMLGEHDVTNDRVRAEIERLRSTS